MRIRNRTVKSMTALVLCLALALGCAGGALAEGTGSFSFAVTTSAGAVIEPVSVSFTQGQTIAQALDASGWSLIRHGSFIDVIEGVSGSYLILYDGGGYDLEQPAESITALLISENTDAGEAHLTLLRYLTEYAARTDHVQNYPSAQAAYESALDALCSSDAETAEASLAALQAAVSEYESLMNGTKYKVTVTATQNGASLSAPFLTMTDVYGNVYTAHARTINVPAGTYSLSVSDGTWNRTEGTVTVTKATSVSAELPYGEWFGEIRLLDQQTREAYHSVQDSAAHTVTLEIPDIYGTQNPVLNAMIGSVPNTATTRLYGVYTGTDGHDYSEDARAWSSTSASLPALFSPGMEGRSFRLEARYVLSSGMTQIQSYDMAINRTPTLSALTVTEENTQLPLSFDPVTLSYAVTATADALTFTAAAFGDYEITGTGTVDVPGDMTHTVTVSADGISTAYDVTVTKVGAVDVTLSVPSGTTVEVFNGADALIEPVGGVYHLIPGDSYTYIATVNGYYHTTAAFTASQGLTVSVQKPETTDRLSDFALYMSYTSSSRKPYVPDSAFSSAVHSLGYTIPDTSAVAYAQATPASGYSVTALYSKQTQNASTYGAATSMAIPNTVGAASAKVLTGCITNCGCSQIVTIRVSKVSGNVTFYQDYELFIRRSLHLKTLSLSDGELPVPLLDDTGSSVEFDRDITEYTISVDRGTQSLTVDGSFTNEGGATPACGGYYALLNDAAISDLTGVTIPLDETQDTETVTVLVRHEEETGVPTAYTLTVVKTDPVRVTFRTTPADATVYITSNATGLRVKPEGDGAFALVPGASYSYTVTAAGYLGTNAESYTAPPSDTEVAVSLSPAPSAGTLPDYDAVWPASRADEFGNGVVGGATPTAPENATLYWATKLGEGYSGRACGCPILVNGCLYTYAGTKIYKVDTVSGEILASGDMDHASSFAINSPTYAEGMIFVGLSDGTVQAFNADTLQSLWIYHDPLKGQPDCPIVYHDGYIYTGFWLGEVAAANYVCLSVTDEDPADPMEEKLPTWLHTVKGGFYWAGAYAADGYLLIGTDDGMMGFTDGEAQILSLEPRTGLVIDSLSLPAMGDVRSGVTFAPDGSGGGVGYFTTKGGFFCKAEVNADGTFAADSLCTLRLTNYTDDPNNPAMSTSTPTVYNGRAYVGVAGTSQFGQYSGHNITVIDLNAWRIAYTVRTQGFPQTSGLLTTAYEAETGSVYVYFFDNYTPGKLRVLKDSPGQNAPLLTVTESYTSGGHTTGYEVAGALLTPAGLHAQYCICSPIADENGTIYFKNDSSYLMAVGSAVTSLEITTPPARTRYAEGGLFDPAGMTVTAHYANGLSRDVTAYVEYSEDPLTAEDAQFQIFFPHVKYHDEDQTPGVTTQEPFAVLELTIGGAAEPADVDGDGDLDADDAALTYALANGTFNGSATEPMLAAADANADGEVTPIDAAIIYAYVNGRITEYPPKP